MVEFGLLAPEVPLGFRDLHAFASPQPNEVGLDLGNCGSQRAVTQASRLPTEPTGSPRSSPRPRSRVWRRNRAGLPIWSSSHHSRSGTAWNATALGISCSWRETDRSASNVRTSTTWPSCLPVTPPSPGEPRRQVDSPQSWCGSVAREVATSARGSSSKRKRSPGRGCLLGR